MAESEHVTMNYDKQIQVLQNEIECVNRDGCDRECCAKCDLAADKADVLAAMSLAVECVQGVANHDLVREVHAQWIGQADGYADGAEVFDTWFCSNCDYCIETDDRGELPKFCPNCGAKMDAEVE